MIKEEKRFLDGSVLEGMTSIRACIDGIRSGVSKRKIKRVLVAKEKMPKISKYIGYLKAVSFELGYEVELVDERVIDEMTVGSTHGGVIAEVGEREIPSLKDAKDTISPDGFYVMMEGIEDPYNFGYSLRSLFALGCDGAVLPPRNWLSAAGVVCRSSAGASERVPMFLATAEEALEIFHALGYTVVCAEEKTDKVLGQVPLKKPILLIVGGEKRGTSKAVTEGADLLVKIDYRTNFPESLSAASAATVFGYEIARQNP